MACSFSAPARPSPLTALRPGGDGLEALGDLAQECFQRRELLLLRVKRLPHRKGCVVGVVADLTTKVVAEGDVKHDDGQEAEEVPQARGGRGFHRERTQLQTQKPRSSQGMPHRHQGSFSMGTG